MPARLRIAEGFTQSFMFFTEYLLLCKCSSTPSHLPAAFTSRCLTSKALYSQDPSRCCRRLLRRRLYTVQQVSCIVYTAFNTSLGFSAVMIGFASGWEQLAKCIHWSSCKSHRSFRRLIFPSNCPDHGTVKSRDGLYVDEWIDRKSSGETTLSR